ncbi:hypothetical protein [Sphaerotilus sp.]|uniref:hypothetical protein n=1 Tax=Sphaerotilus sp. TaxID=2093942 RepID=UPI0034E2191D
MTTPSSTASIILNLGEFIDALAALRRGRVIVVMDAETRDCVLDGARLMSAFRPLHDYGLIAEYDNPAGFEGLRYYRMTGIGKQFADNALAVWQARAWHERLAMRLRC